MVDFTGLDYADGVETNAGIQQYIYGAPVSDILTIQKPSGSPTTAAQAVTIASAHVMKSGKKFEKIYCIRDKGELGAKGIGGLKMKGTETELKIFIPGTKAELKGWLQVNQNRDFIFIVPDRGDEKHQIGTEELPASIKDWDWKVGGKSGDDIGVEVTISAAGRVPYTYAAAIPLVAP